MTNNHHAGGVIGGITRPSAGGQAPSMAMAFNKNGQGTSGKNGSNNQIAGSSGQQMGSMLPSNKQAYGKHQQYVQM